MIAAGVVAALAAEARVFGASTDEGTSVVVSGVGCAAAARASQLLIEQGAVSLVSWGMAGALDPLLAAGAVCLPSVVIDPEGVSFATAAAWREALAARIAVCRPVHGGRLFTSETALDSPASKAAAQRATGASAVDMESSAVARVAAAHGLPFIAVRVIVDTAFDRVPQAVISASSPSGRVSLGRLLAGLLRAPGELSALVRLARRYRAAIGSLSLVASLGALRPPALERPA